MNNLIIHIYNQDSDDVYECRTVTEAYQVLDMLARAESLGSVSISSTSFKVMEDLTKLIHIS
jgi:hypothetical protein|tara:strand:+ start:2223 stop:2408 length:186 start_codon:yes stop_codon:yes gene_type:complete